MRIKINDFFLQWNYFIEGINNTLGKRDIIRMFCFLGWPAFK